MIVTVTLNPSLDRTLAVEHLSRGHIVRTSIPTLEAGGKGVNVARALAAQGVPAVAILPAGGIEGAELVRQLDVATISTRSVPVVGRTRSNITIAEADGTITKLNEPGEPLDPEEFTAILDAVSQTATRGDWVVVSGSMPPQFTSEQVMTLAARVAAIGAWLAIDTSGDALVASLAARPRLIKPNRAELSEIAGHALGSIAEVIAAAHSVRDHGVELVLVSLGADGAVLVGPTGVVVGESQVDRPRSTVGAGDCFLAGFLSRFAVDEGDVETAMLEALAWGAAAASLPGTAVPSAEDLVRSNVRLVIRPDLDRPLVVT